jgi:internalin A
MPESTATPTKPRRRRFVLNLRVLMLVVLIVGGGLGWKARRASIQRRAVAAIKEAGGLIYYDHQIQGNTRVPTARPWAPDWLRGPLGDEFFQEVEQVHFMGPIAGPGPTVETLANVATLSSLKTFSAYDVPIDDEGLGRLNGMPRLELLELARTAITDAGLEHLADLPALDSVMIRARPGTMTGRGLVGLARMPRLRSLFWVGTNFTDPSGLAALGKMARLEKLMLQRTPGDDTYLANVRGLIALKSLVLVGTEATDAGLDQLSGLTRLESLGIGGSKLTDASLTRLAKLTKLEELTWGPTPGITDAGLSHLAGLKSLKMLGLKDSKVTPLGLDRLAGLPLESFATSGLVLTDADLARLIASRTFRDLNLSGTAITDIGAASLAGQPRLVEVGLAGSKVTDAAMAGIATLLELVTLILAETEITDAGLVALQQAPKINYLDVRGTKVTAQGLAAFRKARPSVTLP